MTTSCGLQNGNLDRHFRLFLRRLVGRLLSARHDAGTDARYYTTQFPLVELNYTFYRLPTPRELGNLGRKAPPGFQFVVKLHQSLSHERKPEGAIPFRE